MLEHLQAYAMIAPAMLLVFIFGLFPVAFAFFVSLHRWRRFPEEFRGLDQYQDAIGDFAYVAFFWISAALLIYGGLRLWKAFRSRQGHTPSLVYAAPAVALGGVTFAVAQWIFTLLPVILTVPVRLRGQQFSSELFVSEFFNSFRSPEVLAAHDIMWLAILILIAMLTGSLYLVRNRSAASAVFSSTYIGVCCLISGALLLALTATEMNLAVTAAQETDKQLPVWTMVVLISAGVGLLVLAWIAWQRTVHAESNRRFVGFGLAVIALVIGGYFLITQLPPALAGSAKEVSRGFGVTVMYALCAVPLQLALGLGLAVLLFQNIRGKSFFRIVYFMPYITPFVATSVIFALIFSHRTESPVNQLMTALGLPTQNWLLEPRGVIRLLFGEGVPDALAGPGLALIVIVLYTVWVYAGYATVIFLAGLGNIPHELNEAARIDGANGWQIFRNVTLPLLSPTTFFLVIVATIGTFQAFTQIFLMRRAGAFPAVDTINIYIYNEIRADNPDYAYGSAMAFVLFAAILVLTIAQNRIAGRRVFYG
jgi:multiple sugar transport system permease protein